MTLYDAIKVQTVLQAVVNGSETLIKKDTSGNIIKDEDTGKAVTVPPKYELPFDAKLSIARIDKVITEEVSLYRETKKKEYVSTFGVAYEDADEEQKVKMDADFVETASNIEIVKEIPKLKEESLSSAELPYEYIKILLPILE